MKELKSSASAIFLLLLNLIVPPPAPARAALEYDSNYAPSCEAIRQSNAFALGHEICEPLKDGWQHEGFKILIDEKGQFDPEFCPSLVVDRARDPVLKKSIEEARRRFGQMRDWQKAQALTTFAHSLFCPAGLSDDQLSDWDDAFGNAHRGERVLLGEYIAQGKGVCVQQAVLLKILADELGLPATLYFGFDGKTAHMWTTININGKDLIYDPAQDITGIAPGAAPDHKTISRLYGRNFEKLGSLTKVLSLIAAGQYCRAGALLEQIADMDVQSLGRAHPVYAVSLTRIAELYERQGNERKAEAYLKKALSVTRRAWGRNNQQVADCLNSLGNLEQSLGNDALAERYLKRAIKIYEKTLGKNDTGAADSLYNLADLYRDEGKYRQSKQLFSQALTIYEQCKGPGHKDVQDTKGKLEELLKQWHGS